MRLPPFRGAMPSMGPVRINADSLQARGLAAWWPVDGSAHRDLVTGRLSTSDIGRVGTVDRLALPFTGSNGVNCGTRGDLAGLTQWTASAWVRDVVGMAVKRVLQYGDSSTPPYLQILLYTESGLGKVGSGISAGAVTVAGTTSLASGGWHLLVGTWDGTTLRVYTDGRLENSAAMSGSLVNNGNGTSIGYSTAFGENNTAVIGDCRIYRVALNAREVAHLFAPETRHELIVPA